MTTIQTTSNETENEETKALGTAIGAVADSMLKEPERTLQEQCYGACWAACERIAELEEATRSDTKRMDWLESHNIRITKPDDCPPWIGAISASGDKIREAIDNAIAREELQQ